MPSNALSSKRTYLVKPKVCKSIPKWKKITSGSFPDCGWEPNQITVQVGVPASADFFACLLCEPAGNSYQIDWTPDKVYLLYPPPTSNCVKITVDFEAYQVGQGSLVAKATWFNGATCTATLPIVVIP